MVLCPTSVRLSIIIPALNEAAVIEPLLQSLQSLREAGHEVILVDGGSSDDTAYLARSRVDKLINSQKGRARQMNAGAGEAEGEIFWFLHADSRLSFGFHEPLLSGLAGQKYGWGRFDIALSGRHMLLRLVEFMMNWRSRLSGIATGDQGIFVLRDSFLAVGGFPDIPLMEDIALSRRLKRLSPPLCLRQRLETSSRRWEERGILRTVLLMWELRLAYAVGVDPAKLEKLYR